MFSALSISTSPLPDANVSGSECGDQLRHRCVGRDPATSGHIPKPEIPDFVGFSRFAPGRMVSNQDNPNEV
jgi:hypothetical protein